MGCAPSAPPGQFTVTLPLPVNLSGFKELKGTALWKCIDALQRVKEGDDHVMFENRSQGYPLHRGTLLCGPYFIRMTNRKTGRKIKHPVVDVSKEVVFAYEELRRVIVAGQKVEEFLEKDVDFYRRVIGLCYANRTALRTTNLVFESLLNMEWIRENLVSFMSDGHIRHIGRVFLTIDRKRRGLLSYEDIGDWVGAKNESLGDALFFTILPFLVESKRPGFLNADEWVVFVDKCCTMNWTEAARFVFAQLVNSQTEEGDPAVDLFLLWKNNKALREAKIDKNHLNLVLKSTIKKAYGRKPNTVGTSVFKGKVMEENWVENYRRSQASDAAAQNFKAILQQQKEAQAQSMSIARGSAAKTAAVAADNSVGVGEGVQTQVEEYRDCVLTLPRHMYMAEHSPQYMYPVSYFQTHLRQTLIGEKFWAKRRMAVERARKRQYSRAAELYNKNAVEAYLERKSAEFLMLKEKGEDISALNKQANIDEDLEGDKLDAMLDFKVTMMNSGEIDLHSKKAKLELARKGIENKRAQQAQEVSKLRKKLVGDEAGQVGRARRGSATSAMLTASDLPGMVGEGEEPQSSGPSKRRTYRRSSAPTPGERQGPVRGGNSNTKNKYARKRASFMRTAQEAMVGADPEKLLASAAVAQGAKDGKAFGSRRSSTSTAAASAAMEDAPATAATKKQRQPGRMIKSRASV